MVYAARYHEFCEDAFLDWLEVIGLPYPSLRSSGVDFVITEARYAYRRPARLDDRLRISVAAETVAESSLTAHFEVRRDQHVLVTADVTYVAVLEGHRCALPGPLQHLEPTTTLVADRGMTPRPPSDARVSCAVDGPVATITLDRPDRHNAQTPVTWAALRAIGSDLPDDVRVVVVRGEGPSFSSGLDRAVFTPEGLADVPNLLDVARAPMAEAERMVEAFQEAFSWLERPDLVSVAAVQGHAVGAGFQLALACDLRIAAEDAMFTMPETTLGLVPDLGGTRLLRDLVGYSKALEMSATGRPVAADEAVRLGLVNLVVPREDLDRAVRDLVADLLAPPRDAVMETKALLLGAARRAPGEQLLAERQAQLRRIRDLAGF